MSAEVHGASAPPAADLATDLAVGLSDETARERLRRYGPNEVPEKHPSAVLGFLRKLWGPSAWMVELVVVLSAALHHVADALVASGLLLVNAVLGFAQERHASAAVQTLRSRLRVNARVVRSGSWRLVPAAEIVPGDVIRLRGGDFVPADARAAAGEVTLDQSALTGESAEAAKGAGDLLYSGAIVRRGEATAVVVSTGARTFFGRTVQLVESSRPRLHVEEVVTRLVRWLFALTGGLTATAFAIAALRGIPLLEIVPLLLLLLLSAVPVALPVMFTVSMAVAALELTRRGVLVTRLGAAEDAATMDVLCADKTGTITQNRAAVAEVLPEAGFGAEDVLRLGAMASEEADQDPIDLALLAAARERHAEGRFTVVSFSPFSPETRRTEAVVETGGRRLRVAKGAVATIAEACGRDAREVEARAAAGAARGLRTIAIATSAMGEPLALAGLVQFEDPPRPDSARLVAELRSRGVSVKMLTGDALPVAREVSRALDLGEPVPASRLREALARSREAGAEVARGSEGFAEVFPEDKHAVVEALQAAGHVVGMTGDGVNDAPALRQAEVGIAVRAATDVAREAASVVLTTDGLLGMVQLVEEGRAVYQRVLTWIVNKVSRTIEKSALVVLAFLATGRFVVSTTGMLLLLFMTDFVKISLATDRTTGSRRPETWRIGPWVRVAAWLGVLMLAESLAILAVAWRLFDLGSTEAALQTFSFQMLLFFALFSIVSVRERRRFWASRPSRTLALALVADGILGMVLPLANLPGLRAIPFPLTLVAFGGALAGALLVNEPIKVALLRRAGLADGAGT
jgi:H+-transporting ATPase